MDNVLGQLQYLLTAYSSVRRAMTQPFLLNVVEETFPDYTYDPGDTVIRETLIEHVGCLPVVAPTLYPHICEPDVDLGDVLIMLAIHDIGELVAVTRTPSRR